MPNREFALVLFGTFRLEQRQGGTVHPIRLPRRKVEALLAYLVLHPGHAGHSREKLAALFWGDTPDEQARTSLRTSLAVLRKALGDGALIADRDSVQINPDFPLWVDAREFLETCSTSPESAIALYRGELLAAFYDDWILAERERLSALHTETLLHLIQALRAQSEYERAISFARQLLAAEPANETAHQHIMFCEMARGNRGAALKQYADCVNALRDALAASPSPETQSLYQWLQRAPARPASARITNLPVPVTSFVGRKDELAEIETLLASARLVTLVGAGGSGKTRLAIQASLELIDSFSDGVWWVELANLDEPSLVPQALAKALGVSEVPPQSLVETISDFVRGKQMLLVLDNCEHLVKACAELAGQLLRQGSIPKILATSREPLRVAGENVWPISPLSIPDQRIVSQQMLMDYEGVQLFVERAAALQPDFVLATENAPSVAEICRRLDGIPLAIELAAARVRTLSVEQIAARLDDRFHLLTTGNRATLPRQQTLRALIDWSHNLLSEEERIVFRRLAVFPGGFTLEAAQAILSDQDLTPNSILGALTSLVDKSLLLFQSQGAAPRYRFLETIREYASDELLASGETDRWRRRHWEWFTTWAEAAELELRGADQLPWLERLEMEHDNLRAALGWARSQEDQDRGEARIRLAAALARFWTLRGYWSEGREWLALALTSDAMSAARAKALVGLAELANLLEGSSVSAPLYAASLSLYRALGNEWGAAMAAGYALAGENDPARALSLFSESLSTSEKLKDEWLIASTYFRMGIHAFRLENLVWARDLMEQALAHSRHAGDRWLVCSCLIDLGEVRRSQMDYQSAGTLYAEALTIQRELGDKMIPITLHNMGYIALHQGDCALAKDLFRESLGLNQGLGRKRGMIECIAGLGAVATTLQQPARAVQLLTAVDSLFQAIHEAMDPTDRDEHDSHLAAARRQLQEAAFSAAKRDGESMTLEQAIELALCDA